ncbi:MAG: dihydrolipoyl dehydrogenase [Nitrospiraceae bacterium]|nr:dihydrolipoyl dehydrogenase [Nitrospiraceae bacterium]
MKKYDVIVIGSGAGLLIVENALSHGFSVALVDKGPVGGTCLNLGCIPSKMLICPADRLTEIRESAKLGITAEVKEVDFAAIMKRMAGTVSKGEAHVREGISHSEVLDFYGGTGFFIDDRTIEVNGERIKGEKVVIASGARPQVPPIGGIEGVDFLTNESLLHLRKRPESLLILGGGYIAAEYAHFFSAMGTDVTVLQRNKRLVPDEEPEISALLRKALGRRMQVLTDTEAVAIKKSGREYRVTAKDRSTGKEKTLSAGAVLVATGRTSNADILKVGNSGIETDARNYIKVNEYFETSCKNIWAFGDAIGKKMFRHTANREATLVFQNAFHDAKETLDYLTVPHAVFSYPEIASVGLTEDEARQRFHVRGLLVGKANYSDVARGEAMREEEGFCKAIVKKDGGKIVGFHIIGPHASILIQEVVVAMANDLSMWALNRGIHIHPALPEVIISTFGNLEEPEPAWAR